MGRPALNIPTDVRDIVERCNKALLTCVRPKFNGSGKTKSMRVFWDPKRGDYVLVDLEMGQPVDLLELSRQLGCREPYEVMPHYTPPKRPEE